MYIFADNCTQNVLLVSCAIIFETVEFNLIRLFRQIDFKFTLNLSRT